MVTVNKYQSEDKAKWDSYIKCSKNGTFLFFRDYMDYHSQRFADHSILFYDLDHSLIGVMPANAEGDTIISHGGLTFGGIVTGNSMTASKMIAAFDTLGNYLSKNGFKKLVYKCIPYVYHRLPANEDRYALFLHNAKLSRCDLSTTVFMPEQICFSSRRRRGIKKAKRHNVQIRISSDYRSFIDIVAKLLQEKYNAYPTHNYQEISTLAQTFPHSIKLFAAYYEETMVAGVVVYEHSLVAHAQYIAANETGKRIGALDLVFEYLIQNYYKEKLFFDFGISTEQGGYFLNEGLITQKEEFGARAVVYETYELDI